MSRPWVMLLLTSLLRVPAAQIWELGENKHCAEDFAEAIDNSDLEAFGFTDEFVIELWGAITGVRTLGNGGRF